MITRGFFGRRRDPELEKRMPPGQSKVDGFPVLSIGPTPRMGLTKWQLELKVAGQTFKSWNWNEFNDLPQTEMKRDIHCVTRWTKLDTLWKGVTFDDLLADAGLVPPTEFVRFYSADSYTTNLPLEDLRGDKAMIATQFDGETIAPDHGGPIRMVVPHLYFWKSAKWLTGISFTNEDLPGFWERAGYHNYGDPWAEQRYTDD